MFNFAPDEIVDGSIFSLYKYHLPVYIDVHIPRPFQWTIVF